MQCNALACWPLFFLGKPLRALFLCNDSWVRLVAPTSGAVITTALVAAPELQNHKLVDAAYAIYEGERYL